RAAAAVSRSRRHPTRRLAVAGPVRGLLGGKTSPATPAATPGRYGFSLTAHTHRPLRFLVAPCRLFLQFRRGRYGPLLPQSLGRAQRSTRSVTVAVKPLSRSAAVSVWSPGLLRTKAPRKVWLPWSSAVKV